MERHRDFIGFETTREVTVAVEKERKRLSKGRPGRFAGKAEATRSLILRGSKAKVKADA